jgi:hypothetical protein
MLMLNSDMRTSYDADLTLRPNNQRLLPYRQAFQQQFSPCSPKYFNPSNSTFPRPKVAEVTKMAEVADPGLTESLLGTCNGSFQSLTNDLPTTWRSNVSTNKNSGNQSPISPSNLPDSPSNLFLDGEDSIILAEAIESVMPKPRNVKGTQTLWITSLVLEDTILSEAIESVLPKPRRRDHLNLSEPLACSSNTAITESLQK